MSIWRTPFGTVKVYGQFLLLAVVMGALTWPLPAFAEIQLAKRVFPVVYAKAKLRGTSFRICSPNLVLTAAHVIEGHTPADISILISLSPEIFISPTRIEKHPQADVAALFFDEGETERAGLECFQLGVPSRDYPGSSDYSMGEDTIS